MPAVSVRRISPRGTLPRKGRRRVREAENGRDTEEENGHAENGLNEEDGPTPMASTQDIRGVGVGTSSSSTNSAPINCNGEIKESASMTSSLHRERDEEGDELADLPAAATLPRSRVFASHVKAKRLRFYRNGDQYYKGFCYALRPDRVRTMQPLLEDLTRSMGDASTLPLGVRHLFTLDGQARIMSVDEFVDGESYVCSSSETFKPVDYENAREPTWSTAVNKTPRQLEASQLALNTIKHVPEPNYFVYPRIITVIRNGVKPRRVVRHLLNKRTARSFPQVMADLTSIVKLDSGAIRKLFNLSGQQVTTLIDFFQEDDVFIAYGNERTSADDFYVSHEESSRLFSRGSRRRRRAMPPRNESLQRDRSGSALPEDIARRLPPLLDGRMRILRLLGDGNTAHVYETEDRETGDRRALKIISRENVIGKEELIKNEIDIMQKIDHQNIVRLFDVWEFDGTKYLHMELITGGDLFEHLCECRRVTERNAARMIGSLASALDYMHNRNIVHRDVKLENLLLIGDENQELDLKLADFGLASEMPEDGSLLSVCCGTPTYVAPEVLTNEGYDCKVDVWSMGIILYVMLVGFPPFQGNDGDQEELFREIMRARLQFPSPVFDQISWAAKELIMRTVNIDVFHRFTAEDVSNNQWVQSMGTIDAQYEVMAELNVQTGLAKYADDEEEVEETHREFFCSRRTSMDELSSCADFEYTRTFSRDI